MPSASAPPRVLLIAAAPEFLRNLQSQSALERMRFEQATGSAHALRLLRRESRRLRPPDRAPGGRRVPAQREGQRGGADQAHLLAGGAGGRSTPRAGLSPFLLLLRLGLAGPPFAARLSCSAPPA